MSNKINLKKSKKRVSKIISVLIVLLMIAIVALVIILRVTDKSQQSKEDITYDGEKIVASTKEYLKDKVIPQHIYDFSVEYSGEIERNQFYEQLYIVSKYLSDLCVDLENIDSSEYYSKYSEELKKYLGIEKKDEFYHLAEYLLENDIANSSFEYCVYHSGSMKINGKYSNFKIDFKYENHDAITLNMGILNQTDTGLPILKLIIE